MIKFAKVNHDSVLPTHKDGSAGFDLYAAESVIIPPGQSYRVKSGLIIWIPRGCVGQIETRFKMAFKNVVIALGGLIHPEFKEEIHIGLLNQGMEPLEIRKGDAIAQLVVLRTNTYAGEMSEAERKRYLGSSSDL